MIKFKITNFEIIIPQDTQKLKKQIETLKEQIKLIEQQIESSKIKDEIIHEGITFIKENLLIHQEALEHSQKEYNNRLII